MSLDTGEALAAIGISATTGRPLSDLSDSAVEAMTSMRHDDGAAMVAPVAIAGRHPEVRIHRQRDLDRVMGMGVDAAGVAADPEASSAPEQHAADAGDRAPRRRCGRLGVRKISRFVQVRWESDEQNSWHGSAGSESSRRLP